MLHTRISYWLDPKNSQGDSKEVLLVAVIQAIKDFNNEIETMREEIEKGIYASCGNLLYWLYVTAKKNKIYLIPMMARLGRGYISRIPRNYTYVSSVTFHTLGLKYNT